jgi:predicted RNase H-like HicB family nuclease
MPRPTLPARRPGRLHRYTVYYLRDQEAGGYTAHVPALGIVTEGQTLKSARAMARDAIEGWIEAAQELGKPIPEDVTRDQVEVSA